MFNSTYVTYNKMIILLKNMFIVEHVFNCTCSLIKEMQSHDLNQNLFDVKIHMTENNAAAVTRVSLTSNHSHIPYLQNYLS